jgi:KDO2-lipid IV(A) lauroyltransferase
MSDIKFTKKLLHIKLWPTWLLMAMWWLLVQLLPYRLQMLLGGWLGLLAIKLGKRRRHIAVTNINVCFPEKTPEQRRIILKESSISLGKGFFESGIAWFWPDWRLRPLYTISGLEHLTAARDSGHGVLFMGIHFTPIEICAAFINLSYSIDGFYQPHKNPVYEYVQSVGRTRHNKKSQIIPRKDVRRIVTALREKRVINYAPDQDYGKRNSVFVPFFGVQTATVTAPAKLIRVGNAKIIPYTTRRLSGDSGYHISICPPLKGYGEGDDMANAETINRFVEARVRENPEQYLWVHRRFKSRPDGETPFY